ncbi:hypothetical protein [Larkinella humicola]|uniref:Uncharacterized protein n=1 Tax=Larkinella humicola TaxID=2607654 RepID=A0A5N1JA83_9BACT|nr:hypothetical protein [Larkinella humicola]KAA9349318.1 hypothetical protein F0P93_23275 [Larkinella humicola]
MKLTWTFYSKTNQPITLTVIYVLELDKHQLEYGGFLDTDANRAYVDWATFKRFDDASIKVRKDAFARLKRVTKKEDGMLGDARVRFTPEGREATE